MQLSMKILGILFLGTSLLQASCLDTPPPENSRSSSEQGLSATRVYFGMTDVEGIPDVSPCSKKEAGAFPPPLSLPSSIYDSTGRLITELETLRISDPALGAFMETLGEHEPLSPCTAADKLGALNDAALHKLNLVARMAPSSIMEQLSHDLRAITHSAENLCRDFLQATSYSFWPRPASHMGHTFLWTTMQLLGINFLDGQGKELDLVQFFTRVYGENISEGPFSNAQDILSSHANNTIQCLQTVLTSWGSSLNLSTISERDIPSIVELLVGNPCTTIGLLKLGYDACRYAQHLNDLSPRLAPQTPPPVQRRFNEINTMQECA